MPKKSTKAAADQNASEQRDEQNTNYSVDNYELSLRRVTAFFVRRILGDDLSNSSYVGLREALVAFIRVNLEIDAESCRKLVSERADITHRAQKRFLGVLRGSRSIFSLVFIPSSVFLVSAAINSHHEHWPNILSVVLLATLVTVVIAVVGLNSALQAYTYRWLCRERFRREEDCAAQDTEPNRLINEFLRSLEKEQGVQVHYQSFLLKRWCVLDRRTFGSELSYLLFSSDKHIRRQVPQYGIPRACPRDLFIRRTDLDRMLTRPRQTQGGKGRISSGHFEAALISAALNREPSTMPKLTRRYAALREIHAQLTKWYDKTANQSGNVPKADEVRRKSIGVYRGLLRLAKIERERKRTSTK